MQIKPIHSTQVFWRPRCLRRNSVRLWCHRPVLLIGGVVVRNSVVCPGVSCPRLRLCLKKREEKRGEKRGKEAGLGWGCVWLGCNTVLLAQTHCRRKYLATSVDRFGCAPQPYYKSICILNVRHAHALTIAIEAAFALVNSSSDSAPSWCITTNEFKSAIKECLADASGTWRDIRHDRRDRVLSVTSRQKSVKGYCKLGTGYCG